MQKSLFKGTPRVVTLEDQIPADDPAKGIYYGIGNGMGGQLVVKVQMDGKKIASIDIISHHETEGISVSAIAKVPDMILEAQSTEIDAVSGASNTTNAIKEAVENVLTKAK